jgi:hypothetical protein
MSNLGSVAELRARLDRAAFARACGLEPDEWQMRLLRSENPRVIINAARQSGKSTVTALLALHQALYTSNSLVLVLAPALRQSQEFFSKLASFYSVLGEPKRKYSERRLSLELMNGSRVVSLPGSERTVRGYSGASLIVLDEASRIEDELYLSVRPMTAVSGGRLVLLSTPWGKRGVFYETWKERHEQGWESFEVPATQCSRISEEFLEEERRTLGPIFFDQEYLCLFKDVAGALISSEVLDLALDRSIEPLYPDFEETA